MPAFRLNIFFAHPLSEALLSDLVAFAFTSAFSVVLTSFSSFSWLSIASFSNFFLASIRACFSLSS